MASRSKQTPFHKKIRRTTTKHARLALVPHRENQFKPHLIRRHGLVVILLAVIVAQFVGQSEFFSNVLGVESRVTIAALLNDTNNERQKVGEKPLELNAQLSNAAYLKARDMLEHQYWDHTSPQGVSPWKWVSDAQYNYAYAGENLARNFMTSAEAVRAWMESPGHRANILKQEYRDVGFATITGTLHGRNVSLIVAMYGTPATGALASVQGAHFAIPGQPKLSLASQIGLSLQSMNPMILGSVILLLFAACVAVVTHSYRRYIPHRIRTTWQRHHGLVKALGLSSVAVIVMLLYGVDVQL